MSDNNGHPTPNNMPGAGGGGGGNAATPPGQGVPGGPTVQTHTVPTPPWGTDPANYDPDTAAKLIANLRDSEDKSGKTIKSQSARIAALESQLAQAQLRGEAQNQQPSAEQDAVAALRQDMDALKAQLTAAQQSAQANRDAALNARARELAANREGAAFVSPAVATRLIASDLAGCLTAVGQIDDAAIASKLDALATAEPSLLAPAGMTPRQPNPAQGQGNGSIPAANAQQLAEKNGDVKSAMHAAATQLAALTRTPQY